MIRAVAPGLCSAALSKVSRENLPKIPIHYQIAIINALQIQYSSKYKYKNNSNTNTTCYAQIQSSVTASKFFCDLYELSPSNATSVSNHHIHPSGEEGAIMFDIVPYFLRKYKYKLAIRNKIQNIKSNKILIRTISQTNEIQLYS